LDNRPLKFDEFEQLVPRAVFVSATPGDYEIARSGKITQLVVRPTGLLDPPIEVRPSKNQIDDLVEEVLKRAAKDERTLVTTLTKRMSEDLARYLSERKLRVKYLHSEIDAIERVEILKALRQNEFDCLVGINLLREGLDLPEVSLVAILDADKEGFLRSETSLIQTAGRAARHIDGRVILYADRVTNSMKKMMDESTRRRKIQEAYNKAHGITPTGIHKKIHEGIEGIKKVRELVEESTGLDSEAYEHAEILNELEIQMEDAARNLHFEKAILLRDRIDALKQKYFPEERKSQGRSKNEKKHKSRRNFSKTRKFRRRTA
jgi:excinuclease ABC subunit B